MAAIDFCPPSAATAFAQPTASSTAAEFSCAACSDLFATAAEQRAHCKSERHVYNTKRKLAGLKPISQEAWARKVSSMAAAALQQKGTAHLKAGKDSQRERAGSGPTPSSREESAAAPPTEDDEPPTPRRCLFDRKRFNGVNECLAYMEKTYSFFIPDQEYCTDLPGLLIRLGQKISEPPHACIFCNRKFPNAASVRRHMIDKRHTRIGTEAYSRRGHYDEVATEQLQEELEDFYDYHASTREVTDLIQEPGHKVAAIFRFFDVDRDDRLRREEVAQLWAATTNGDELTDAQYLGACSLSGTDPEEGLDLTALGALYEAGIADLDSHFSMVKERLAQRRPQAGKRLDACVEGDVMEDACVEAAAGPDANGEHECDEGLREEGEKNDEEDCEDTMSSDGSDEDVVECEDEDEFEEVMRVLGLQPVSFTPNGDLQLPNGNVATHRDVQYIFRQRGRRPDQLMFASGHSARGPKPPSQLMLSGGTTSGCARIAVSHREQARQGKMIVAVLREKASSDVKISIKQNKLQIKNGIKIRTGRGDCSGGR